MVANPLVPLGSAEVHDLRSEAVGDTFRIFLGHCGENPRHTLFVTDANGLFGLTTDTVRLMQIPALAPSLLVVGIGYPDTAILAETVTRRPRDLAPTPSPKYFPGSGGAGRFLDFLTGELSGWVRERHPGALDRTVYFGHSLGGLFGAHTLLDRPGAFDHLIISSPSLWWDHREIFRREEQYAAAHGDLAASAYLAIGGLETDAGRRLEAAALPDGHHAKPLATHLNMVDDLVRFTDSLAGRGYPSLDLHREIIPDEFHNTVAGVALTRGLRRFLGPPAPGPQWPDGSASGRQGRPHHRRDRRSGGRPRGPARARGGPGGGLRPGSRPAGRHRAAAAPGRGRRRGGAG